MSNRPPDSLRDRILARRLMRRQARLSLQIGAVFLVLVLGVPLVNHFLPEISATPMFGFRADWLLLGVLFYPITWLLSAVFVGASERLERVDAQMVREEFPDL